MPNQSLVDLTERTATADTDLIHVNSGGSDYKQTKANFLQGNLAITFDQNSSITAQADALPGTGTYFGTLISSGHQSETGTPLATFWYVRILCLSSYYRVIDLWGVDDPQANHYVKHKRNNTWASDWTKVPSRAEITSLNNSLTKYYDATAVASVTIGSGGYTELSRPSAVVGKRILAISVLNWSTASGAFNAAILRDTGTRYMIYGTPNVTITSLELRWVYQD